MPGGAVFRYRAKQNVNIANMANTIFNILMFQMNIHMIQADWYFQNKTFV